MYEPVFVPIWLPHAEYGEYQRSRATVFAQSDGFRFAAVEFEREYAFDADIASVEIAVTGDTRFYLWYGGSFVCAGPVAEGGDYGCAEAMKKHCYTVAKLPASGRRALFFARVYLGPDVMTDYSQGRGAFMLEAKISFSDGSFRVVRTGDDWLARLNRGWKSTTVYDGERPDEWVGAETVEYPCALVRSPLPLLTEERVVSAAGSSLCAAPGETVTADFPLDKIWAGYLAFTLTGGEGASVDAEVYERDARSVHARESVRLTDGGSRFDYRSLRLQSCGGYRVTLRGGSGGARIDSLALISTHYPVCEEGSFVCSDASLNTIYETAKHTLKICRQTLHLDSPLHQETLGCTGDYYIESLMSYFAFGDARLTRLDIVRTADRLVQSGGRMFHTTYSLIWLQMAWDYYIFSGDDTVFGEIDEAVRILLSRFHGYTDGGEVIVNAPNWMFVDWVPLDGFNMHHPPRCAGQTVMNAFYYKALRVFAAVCSHRGDDDGAALYGGRADRLKRSFARFWDSARGLYFDGENADYAPNEWLPADNGRRYFSKHANSLAVLYGLCPDDARTGIMEKVMTDETLTDVQPYFMHYVLGALYEAGLFDKYGIAQLHRFTALTDKTTKGLAEGWGAFNGDFSHAWGGTAVYRMPQAFCGFEMVEPGFRAVRLRPRLYGLEYADVRIPTPYGELRCVQRAGEPPEVHAPGGVKVELLP